jgi:hypothetical protein
MVLVGLGCRISNFRTPVDGIVRLGLVCAGPFLLGFPTWCSLPVHMYEKQHKSVVSSLLPVIQLIIDQ